MYLSELHMNIPGFSQLSNGMLTLMNPIMGLLLKHWQLGLGLRGMCKILNIDKYAPSL